MNTTDLKYVMRVMDDHYKNLISRDGRHVSEGATMFEAERKRIMGYLQHRLDLFVLVDDAEDVPGYHKYPDDHFRPDVDSVRMLEFTIGPHGKYVWGAQEGQVLIARHFTAEPHPHVDKDGRLTAVTIKMSAMR